MPPAAQHRSEAVPGARVRHPGSSSWASRAWTSAASEGTEPRIPGQGFPPVAAGLAGVAEGVPGVAEAIVGAGLVVRVTHLPGHVERGGVLGTSWTYYRYR